MSDVTKAWEQVHANKGLTIQIHLNEVEVGNIGGWVSKGFLEPEFAAYPWRLVLEQRDRARFDEIAAQFVAAGLVTPPGSTGEPPPPPPVETPVIYDFCKFEEDIRWTVPWGDYTRYCTRDVGDFRFNNVCLQITMPADAKSFGVDGYVSLAEFDGNPAMREMTISRHACDFRPTDPTGVNGPMARCFGKQATLYFNVLKAVGHDSAVLQPAKTYYVNVRNWESATNSPSVPPTEQDYIELENGTRVLRKYSAGISVIWPH